MYYVTIKQPDKWTQISLEDFLNGLDSHMISQGGSGTITYERDHISTRLHNSIDCDNYIARLKHFNDMTEPLRTVPRESLYREFTIPKKSGGRRTIDAPNDMLKAALRTLKEIFEDEFGVLYHTSAYAYVKKRSAVEAMKKHQQNESRWFAKYDFTNFFGSITIDFAMEMLEKIFPFCDIIESGGREELYKAVELGFLRGGLPQGTPLSPTLTNILMIPIDFKISQRLRNSGENFCYTRYADDFQISSKYTFSFREQEKMIKDVLNEFNAPMILKPEKTRYGSSSGANWNLGVMLNRENNITIGHETKKKYQAALAAFIMDTIAGTPWDLTEVQILEGKRNYYKQIEGEVIDKITDHVGRKFGVDPVKMIKDALRP